MMRCCENCGWLSVNPGGAMFCGYSEERTWKDECCMAWKDKDEPRTNADRIRAISDEELARFLDFNFMTMRYSMNYERWLAWLQEEVKDDSEMHQVRSNTRYFCPNCGADMRNLQSDSANANNSEVIANKEET